MIKCILFSMSMLLSVQVFAADGVTAEDQAAVMLAQKIMEFGDETNNMMNDVGNFLGNFEYQYKNYTKEWDNICLKNTFMGDSIPSIQALVKKSAQSMDIGEDVGTIVGEKLYDIRAKSCVISVAHTANQQLQIVARKAFGSKKPPKTFFAQEAEKLRKAIQPYKAIKLTDGDAETIEMVHGVLEKQIQDTQKIIDWLISESK